MRRALSLLAPLLVVAALASAEPTPGLPRSSPERQGVSSESILKFLAAAEAKIDALHSFMLVRHGHVVAEGWWTPYDRDSPHMLYSLSKSFTSTAVGMAVAEGKLSVDDAVLPFFPEDAPAEPSANLKSMRVSDLLTMSTGHHAEDLQKFSFQSQERLTQAFLGLPVAHKPGTHFLYNTPATYMQSAIVQKVTGQKLIDYLGPRLFQPLGIEGPTWEESPQGVSLGGFGLKVRTEDIARFGQLYLQKGVWQGKRLIPEAWVAAATARQVSNGSNPASDWEQGYGYQFWRCRHGVYRGDGAFGQFCVVLPDKDAVIAITSGTRDLQGVLNVIWDELLPGLQGQQALAADDVAEKRLRSRLASLTLPPQPGKPTSPAAKKVSRRTYAFPANEDNLEAMATEADARGTALLIKIAGQETRIPLGSGDWRRGGTLKMGGLEQKLAGSGAWSADDQFSAKVCGYESPYCLTLALHFAGDELTLDREWNVALGQLQRKRPQLVGRAEPQRKR